MGRIVWSPGAADELETICQHIAKDSEHYAKLVAQRVIAAVERIGSSLASGSIVPEYDHPKLRERFVHRYRIIDRHDEGDVEIVMIRHSTRLLPKQPDAEPEE